LTRRRVLTIEEEEIVPALLTALQNLERDTGIYEDADLRLELRESTNAGKLTLKIELEAVVTTDRWVVAVTDDVLAADYICAVTDKVNEVLSPAPLEDPSWLPVMNGNVHPVGRRVPHPSPLIFESITSAEVATIAGHDELEHLLNVQWFAATLGNTDGAVRLTFTHEDQINYATRYCYWSAPRRMYVNAIVVDASHFPSRASHRLSVQPFLGAPVVSDERDNEGFYRLNVDAFIERGNGVAFIWGDA
jgi:hypothetical protein